MVLFAWHLVQDATLDVVVRMPKDSEPCQRWVDSLRESGLRVRVSIDSDPAATLREYHVPHALEADHAAVLINGPHFVIVGHVPADAVAQLRKHPIPIHGLAVPGSPAGAPGFSGTGTYEIWAFTETGRTFLFEKRDVVRRIVKGADPASQLEFSPTTLPIRAAVLPHTAGRDRAMS